MVSAEASGRRLPRPFPAPRPGTGSRSVKALSGALLRYRIMAFTVGVGLVVLVFVGMPLQFAAHDKAVVEVVGPFHGFLYIVYLATALDLARRGNWSLWQLAGAVAAGFVPGLAFVVEHFVTRRVRGQIAALEAAAPPTPSSPASPSPAPPQPASP